MSVIAIPAAQPDNSPFDTIRHVGTGPDGSPTEWWSARELMPHLGYPTWFRSVELVERAKVSCRVNGLDASAHFMDATVTTKRGDRGGTQTISDYHLSRHACLLVAMCGDVRKKPIADAQGYFSFQIRWAEREQAAPAKPRLRPWYERVCETWTPHVCLLRSEFRGYFTVVSEIYSDILQMEDQLHLHEIVTGPADRPDISIGARWASERRRQGLPDAVAAVPLFLAEQNLEVMVKLYAEEEAPAFRRWMWDTYLPECYPAYLDAKKSFASTPELARASAADVTCRKLTGRPAKLKPHLREQLVIAGEAVPASRAAKFKQLAAGVGR
jgi:hypothetical protein